MNNTPQVTKPKVDAQYWFDLSKEMVQNSTLIRNEAAAKLQTMIAWFWGIYTASATVGIGLSKTTYPIWVIWLIAVPIPFLLIAYWLTIWTQMPVQLTFDPKIPSDIEDAYLEGVKSKGIKLNAALTLSLIATIFVAVALLAASTSKQTIPPNFQAHLQKMDRGDIIVVAGHFPSETNIVLRAKPVPPMKVKKTSKEFIYPTTQSGELQYNFKFDLFADKYELAAEWVEKDGLTRSLTRSILRESSK